MYKKTLQLSSSLLATAAADGCDFVHLNELHSLGT